MNWLKRIWWKVKRLRFNWRRGFYFVNFYRSLAVHVDGVRYALSDVEFKASSEPPLILQAPKGEPVSLGYTITRKAK